MAKGGLQHHKLIYLFRDKQVFSTEIYEWNWDLISRVIHMYRLYLHVNYMLKHQHVRIGMVT